MKNNFRADFWWGAATSGPQTEGTNKKVEKSIMDFWYDQAPNDFFDQVGPNISCDTYNRFEEDVDLIKQLGLNSFRTSIQWTRIYKDVETEELSEEGVNFYKQYFKKLRQANVKVVVNLFHFDMPIKFENINGFANPYVIDKYCNYANKCFELFGEDIDYWATFNEPVVPIEACYLYQWYYPKKVDFKLAIQAGFGTIVAHAKVVNSFHALFKNNPKKKISVILNVTPTYPRTNHQRDIQASEIRDLLFNKVFMDAMIKGKIPNKLIEFLKASNLLPKYELDEIKAIQTARIDFLGVNYYQPARIQAPSQKWGNAKLMPEKWFQTYHWPERRINPYRGWEIHPETLYHIGMDIMNNYDNIPWFVSENGIGVEDEQRFINKAGIIEDDYRIEFIEEHLFWLSKAIEEGTNCFGYHMWTLIDCWSWGNAFKNRYGFVSLDLKTGQRTIKKSGIWMKNLIKSPKE